MTGLNQLWGADITDVRLPRAFAYLAVLLDTFRRKVIGWTFSRWLDTTVAIGRQMLTNGERHFILRNMPGRHKQRSRTGSVATSPKLSVNKWDRP